MTARVLLVDDDADVLEAMQLVLEDSGYEVLVAAEGSKALDLLRKGAAPSVILLDLMMPGMNGRQFIAEARREALLDEIPVVVVSGGAFRKEDVLALGVADYLTKPVDLQRLASTLCKYCPATSLSGAVRPARLPKQS